MGIQKTISAEYEHEVHEKDGEIRKLREWITSKGLPATKSLRNLQQEIEHEHKIENAMEQELKQMNALNKAQKAQINALQTEIQSIGRLHIALQKEHESVQLI